MNPFDMYISKKWQKVLDLFKSKSVAFSKVMEVGKYTNPQSAYDYIVKLATFGKINNVWIGKSFFVTK